MSSTVGMALSRHELPRYNFPDIASREPRMVPPSIASDTLKGLAVLAFT
jgi:hypothetical protein